MDLILFGTYLFLAGFNAGNMTTLQFQHYSVYPFVGKDGFKNYMSAQNRSARIPSVIPAILLLLVNLGLIFFRPGFMTGIEVAVSVALNLVALVSTFTWQRKLQGEMAQTGYDQAKINQLLSTNLIRVIAFNCQALLAVSIAVAALTK